MTEGADLVLVHEWNDPSLVAAVGAHNDRRRLPPALPRHPPPGRDGAGGDGALRPVAVRRGAGLRRGRSGRPVPRPRLDRPGVDLARGRRHPRLRPARGRRAHRRPGLDRQLGRRRAHRRAARVPARPGPRPRAAGAGARRALPDGGDRGAGGGRHPLRRLDRQPPRARGVRRPRRHRPRAAPAVRRGAARHPHDPAVRGAGLRHPAGRARRGRTSRGCSRPGTDFLVARDGREMRSPPARRPARRRRSRRRCARAG